MPDAFPHSLFGGALVVAMLALGFVPKNTLGMSELVFWLVLGSFVVITAQLPDVDHHKSRVAIWLTFTMLSWAAWFLYKDNTFKVWALILPLILLWGLRAFRKISHRGICHSPLFAMFILPLPALIYFDYQFYIVGAVMSGGHVLLDKLWDSFGVKKKRKK